MNSAKSEQSRTVVESATVQSGTRLPVLTIAVVVITTIGAILQFINPQVLTALRRDPAALAAGQWWRIVSPLIVLDGNLWIHYVLDTLGFLLVGTVVERRIGWLRWLVLFVVAALAGEIAGYAWDPTGAGASIALCGLLGGLVVWQIRYRELELVPSIYTVGLVVALALEAVAASVTSNETIVYVVAAVVCAVLINVLIMLRRRAPDPQTPALFVAVVALIGALVLIVLRDIHGVALLVGLIVAGLLLWRVTEPTIARQA